MTRTQTPALDDPRPPSPTAAPTPRRHIPGRVATLIDLIVAVVAAAVVSLAGLKIVDAVGWPAFNSSNVTRALTTVGQVVAVAFVVAAAILYRYRRSRWLTTLASTIGVAGLVTATLGMPLGATRLYLGGLSVDQQFRTEYLTRLTSSPHLADMTYPDLAPYYPAGWFWWGGRFANAVGQPGWEAFKPWAILTIAVAAAVGVVLWNRMLGADRGAAVALAVTTTTLMQAGPEPYAAVLILIGIPLLVPMMYGLRGHGRLADGPSGSLRSGTSWWAVVAGGVFLGLCAASYTLYAGLFAGVAVLMALVVVALGWRGAANKAVAAPEVSAARRDLVLAVAVRLIVMAVVSGLIALLVWTPYLLARLRNTPASGGTAEHYLPGRGSVLPLPMFELSLTGAITMIGLLWILVRFRTRTVALTFGITVVGIYLFCLLSMLRTATGSTLLSFRLEPILVAVLAAAGVLGVVDLSRWAVGRFGDIRIVIGAIAAVAAIAMAQGVPDYLANEINTAYTDTDGYGHRADQRPSGAESFYPQIDHLITEQTGRPATGNVVLTADYGFLSVYPYWGFQGLTSHYANPLAEFDKRAATIEKWTQATTPDEMIAQLDHSAWKPPNVFLFRYSADGYTLRLAKDVYPNDPNVKRYTVTFDPKAFADPRFTVTEVGPFVLVVRK
ncbi:galactan 5-O-arabinofuranosyltransferase [Gordonia sp. DT219]|uniref:galactan 5-O-arabinofuranosyltransferase n=1 Tax=Gordonia sp. DT219 TaxID=3416658 RepID=UPI003CEBA8C4